MSIHISTHLHENICGDVMKIKNMWVVNVLKKL